MSVQTFSERRNGILETYHKVVNDLETLNADIDQQVENNKAELERIQQENKELSSLKGNNNSTIKTLTKLFS